MTQVERQQVEKLLSEGRGVREAARNTGWSKSQIEKIKKGMEVSQADASTQPHASQSALAAECFRLFDQGKKPVEVLEELGTKHEFEPKEIMEMYKLWANWRGGAAYVDPEFFGWLREKFHNMPYFILNEERTARTPEEWLQALRYEYLYCDNVNTRLQVFRIPCPRCGKDMVFAEEDLDGRSLDAVYKTLTKAFKHWRHRDCNGGEATDIIYDTHRSGKRTNGAYPPSS